MADLLGAYGGDLVVANIFAAVPWATSTTLAVTFVTTAFAFRGVLLLAAYIGCN